MVARRRVGTFMIIPGFCVGEFINLPHGCVLVHLGQAAYTDNIQGSADTLLRVRVVQCLVFYDRVGKNHTKRTWYLIAARFIFENCDPV